MVERFDDDALSAILKAVSDPNRRKLLTILVQDGPMRVTDLASRFDMSLNAVSKHIRVLEQAGLVSRKTEWRVHIISVEMASTRMIDDWFRQLRSTWEMRLERLDQLMMEEDMTATDLSLKVSRRIPAPAQRLFDAWLDPEMLMKFICPDHGMGVKSAETDPRVGGKYSIIMLGESGEIPHWGAYQEITPHSRIVFTWESAYSIPGSTVTLTFEETDGGTDVTLLHERFLNEEMRDNHEKGWTSILAKLDETLS